MAIGPSRLLLFHFCVIIHLVALTIAQLDFFHHICVIDSGNYTTNSTYQENLNSLLSSISSNSEINYGFYNFSAGLGSDKVYAIALCRGDTNLDDCRSCVNDSISKRTQLCPNRKEAIIWYDSCMLRYSNHIIFHTVEVDTSLSHYVCNPYNVSSLNRFNHVLGTLLDALRTKVASGGSLSKFAVGYTPGPDDSKTLYALVQCTPDLSEMDCSDCPISLRRVVSKFCDGKEGVRVVSPSCVLRFEIFRFYDQKRVDELTLPSPPLSLSPPPPSLPPPPSNNTTPSLPTPPSNNTTPSLPPPPSNNTTIKGNENNISRTVIIIVVLAAALMISIISIFIICRVKIFKEKISKTIHRYFAPFIKNVKEITYVESLQFDIGTIRAATENFSDSKMLGQGGFGIVYKGTLFDGQEIAVKRLLMNSKQGEDEFKNEVTLVARLQHRNLVRLLGYCSEQKERILIYEFLPNSSLDHFIFDPIKREDFNWERRYKIIQGIARGLIYLHEDSRLRIIHRDLKASNILLDLEMNPKISDFGIARLFEIDQTHTNTNRVVGTRGYMAPEYILHQRVSIKSDVFSFGILVLEIVSGLKRSTVGTEEEIHCLLTDAWKRWNEGTASNLIDPTLREGSRNEMMRCVHIGLLCVQESVSDRPTMASVVHMLNSDSLTLPHPSRPGFFMHSSVIPESSLEHNAGSTESNQLDIEIVPLSKDESLITEPYAR